jgi:hypothetical protein
MKIDARALLEGITPGEWEAGYENIRGEYIGVFLSRKSSAVPRTICKVSPTDKSDAEDKYNAVIIATAPSLARRVIELEDALRKAYEAMCPPKEMSMREWNQVLGKAISNAFEVLSK